MGRVKEDKKRIIRLYKKGALPTRYQKLPDLVRRAYASY